MSSEPKETGGKDKLLVWRRIARGIIVFAAVSAGILSVLLIANYIQIKIHDPMNNEVLVRLNEHLLENPEDGTIKEEIRALDLLARRAYFTYQWQLRTGAYLLFAFLLVLLLGLKFLSSLQPRLPDLTESVGPEHGWESQLLARRVVLYGGLGVMVLGLVLGLVSQSDLDAHGPGPASTENIQAAGEGADPSVVAEEPDSGAVEEAEALSDSGGPDEIAASWPGFRGPGGIGVARRAQAPTDWNGPSGKSILWKTPVPMPGYNSPIVWGNRVFLSGSDGDKQAVFCFDGDTGELLWRADLNDIPGSPAAQPNVSHDTGFAAPTMTTDGERVFVLFANGDVACLDLEGQRIWSKNLGMPDNNYGHASSLIAYQNVLIVPFDQQDGGRLLGLRTTTGDVVYDRPRDVEASWASPILVNTGGRFELILSATPFVMAHDPLTGREFWRVQAMSGEVAPSPAFADGMVYAVNEYASLVGIKVEGQPEVVWESLEDLSEVSSPVATDEFVFVATSFGTISCFDAKTGERYWYHDFDEGFYSSPIVVGDRVYAMDVTGVVSVFRAQRTYELISRNELGERAVTVPAFVGDRIYIRGETHLFSIGN